MIGLFSGTKAGEFAAKYGAKIGVGLLSVALFGGSLLGAYFYGKQVERLANAKDQIELAKRETDLANRNAELASREAEIAGARRALQEEQVTKGFASLRATILSQARRPDCDLSEEELRQFQAIGEANEKATTR